MTTPTALSSRFDGLISFVSGVPPTPVPAALHPLKSAVVSHDHGFAGCLA
jgi:hypothetical protein